MFVQNFKIAEKSTCRFLFSIYNSNESIDFVPENPNFVIEVLDELGLCIDKK
jgi:hypothetical protein